MRAWETERRKELGSSNACWLQWEFRNGMFHVSNAKLAMLSSDRNSVEDNETKLRVFRDRKFQRKLIHSKAKRFCKRTSSHYSTALYKCRMSNRKPSHVASSLHRVGRIDLSLCVAQITFYNVFDYIDTIFLRLMFPRKPHIDWNRTLSQSERGWETEWKENVLWNVSLMAVTEENKTKHEENEI